MKILVACEYSGRVREAFRKRGHDVWSCDLEPSDDDSPYHLTGDVRPMLRERWDMVIAHPPCTRLCNSGVRWLHVPPAGRTLDDIWLEFAEGVEFFQDCLNANAPRVAVENPTMHKYAQVLLGPPSFAVQPHHHGDQAFKRTCYHTIGLPPLRPSDPLTPPKPGTVEHHEWSAVHRAPPGPDRWKVRSRTFLGIAEAKAEPWGSIPLDL